MAPEPASAPLRSTRPFTIEELAATQGVKPKVSTEEAADIFESDEELDACAPARPERGRHRRRYRRRLEADQAPGTGVGSPFPSEESRLADVRDRPRVVQVG